MSATNDVTMRRTVFATATGAAGTLLMSPASADDESPKPRGPYRIEDWGRTPQEYAKRIIDLLDFIPDFRAEPMEHATNGDVMFVRWIARGTSPKGPFEAVGVDRLIVPNGYVAENLILSDHPIFADFARFVGDFRGA